MPCAKDISRVGDGNCDSEFNTPECYYDGADCFGEFSTGDDDTDTDDTNTDDTNTDDNDDNDDDGAGGVFGELTAGD